jgi:hypothetical protein
MRGFLGRRPTPAMAVAFVALLAALSGTAIALPGKNSVDSGDIKNKQVKGKDLANNSVTSKKVKAGSLNGSDVADESLTGSDVNEGSLGKVPSATNADHATSADNATTADNATNADSVGGTASGEFLNTFHQVSATSASNSDPKSVTANCALGEVALGGSGSVAGGTDPEAIIVRETNLFQQFRILNFQFAAGFTATGGEDEPDAGNWTVTARVTCAKGG